MSTFIDGKEYHLGQQKVFALLYGGSRPTPAPKPNDDMPNSRDEEGKTWRDRKRLL